MLEPRVLFNTTAITVYSSQSRPCIPSILYPPIKYTVWFIGVPLPNFVRLLHWSAVYQFAWDDFDLTDDLCFGRRPACTAYAPIIRKDCGKAIVSNAVEREIYLALSLAYRVASTAEATQHERHTKEDDSEEIRQTGLPQTFQCFICGSEQRCPWVG